MFNTNCYGNESIPTYSQGVETPWSAHTTHNSQGMFHQHPAAVNANAFVGGYGLGQVQSKELDLAGVVGMKESSGASSTPAATNAWHHSRMRYSSTGTAGVAPRGFLPYQMSSLPHYDSQSVDTSHFAHGTHHQPLWVTNPNAYSLMGSSYQREHNTYAERADTSRTTAALRHTTAMSNRNYAVEDQSRNVNASLQQQPGVSQVLPQHCQRQSRQSMHQLQQQQQLHHQQDYLRNQMSQRERDPCQYTSSSYHQEGMRVGVDPSLYHDQHLTQQHHQQYTQEALRKASETDRRTAFTSRQAWAQTWPKPAYVPFETPQTFLSNHRSAGSAFQPLKQTDSDPYSMDSIWAKSAVPTPSSHVAHATNHSSSNHMPLATQSWLHDTSHLKTNVYRTQDMNQVTPNVPSNFPTNVLNLDTGKVELSMSAVPHELSLYPQAVSQSQRHRAQHPASVPVQPSLPAPPVPQNHMKHVAKEPPKAAEPSKPSSTARAAVLDVRQFLATWDEDLDLATPRPAIVEEEPEPAPSLVVLDYQTVPSEEAASLLQLYPGLQLSGSDPVVLLENPANGKSNLDIILGRAVPTCSAPAATSVQVSQSSAMNVVQSPATTAVPENPQTLDSNPQASPSDAKTSSTNTGENAVDEPRSQGPTTPASLCESDSEKGKKSSLRLFRKRKATSGESDVSSQGSEPVDEVPAKSSKSDEYNTLCNWFGNDSMDTIDGPIRTPVSVSSAAYDSAAQSPADPKEPEPKSVEAPEPATVSVITLNHLVTTGRSMPDISDDAMFEDRRRPQESTEEGDREPCEKLESVRRPPEYPEQTQETCEPEKEFTKEMINSSDNRQGMSSPGEESVVGKSPGQALDRSEELDAKQNEDPRDATYREVCDLIDEKLRNFTGREIRDQEPQALSDPIPRDEVPQDFSDPVRRDEVPQDLLDPIPRDEVPQDLLDPIPRDEVPHDFSDPVRRDEVPQDLSDPIPRVEVPQDLLDPVARDVTDREQNSDEESRDVAEQEPTDKSDAEVPKRDPSRIPEREPRDITDQKLDDVASEEPRHISDLESRSIFDGDSRESGNISDQEPPNISVRGPDREPNDISDEEARNTVEQEPHVSDQEPHPISHWEPRVISDCEPSEIAPQGRSPGNTEPQDLSAPFDTPSQQSNNITNWDSMELLHRRLSHSTNQDPSNNRGTEDVMDLSRHSTDEPQLKEASAPKLEDPPDIKSPDISAPVSPRATPEETQETTKYLSRIVGSAPGKIPKILLSRLKDVRENRRKNGVVRKLPCIRLRRVRGSTPVSGDEPPEYECREKENRATDSSARENRGGDCSQSGEFSVTGNVPVGDTRDRYSCALDCHVGDDYANHYLDRGRTTGNSRDFSAKYNQGGDLTTGISGGGDFSAERSQGGDFHVKHNQGGDLTIGFSGVGDFSSEISRGGDFSAKCKQGGDLTTGISGGGDFSAERSQGGDFYVKHNQGGDLTIGFSGVGDFSSEISRGGDFSAKCNQGGDLTTEISGGGDFSSELSRGGGFPAKYNQGGDLTTRIGGGGDFSTKLSQVGDFTAKLSGGGDFRAKYNQDGDWTTRISGGEDFSAKLSRDEDFPAQCNQGGDLALKISRGGDFSPHYNQGGDFSMELRGGGDFSAEDMEGADLTTESSGDGDVCETDSQVGDSSTKSNQGGDWTTEICRDRDFSAEDNLDENFSAKVNQIGDLSAKDEQIEDLSAKDEQIEDLSVKDCQDENLSTQDSRDDVSVEVSQSGDVSVEPRPGEDTSAKDEDFCAKDSQNRDLPTEVGEDGDLSVEDNQIKDFSTKDNQVEDLSAKDKQIEDLSAKDCQSGEDRINDAPKTDSPLGLSIESGIKRNRSKTASPVLEKTEECLDCSPKSSPQRKSAKETEDPKSLPIEDPGTPPRMEDPEASKPRSPRQYEEGETLDDEGKVLNEEGKILNEEDEILHEEGEISDEEGEVSRAATPVSPFEKKMSSGLFFRNKSPEPSEKLGFPRLILPLRYLNAGQASPKDVFKLRSPLARIRSNDDSNWEDDTDVVQREEKKEKSGWTDDDSCESLRTSEQPRKTQEEKKIDWDESSNESRRCAPPKTSDFGSKREVKDSRSRKIQRSSRSSRMSSSSEDDSSDSSRSSFSSSGSSRSSSSESSSSESSSSSDEDSSDDSASSDSTEEAPSDEVIKSRSREDDIQQEESAKCYDEKATDESSNASIAVGGPDLEKTADCDVDATPVCELPSVNNADTPAGDAELVLEKSMNPGVEMVDVDVNPTVDAPCSDGIPFLDISDVEMKARCESSGVRSDSGLVLEKATSDVAESSLKSAQCLDGEAVLENSDVEMAHGSVDSPSIPFLESGAVETTQEFESFSVKNVADAQGLDSQPSLDKTSSCDVEMTTEFEPSVNNVVEAQRIDEPGIETATNGEVEMASGGETVSEKTSNINVETAPVSESSSENIDSELVESSGGNGGDVHPLDAEPLVETCDVEMTLDSISSNVDAQGFDGEPVLEKTENLSVTAVSTSAAIEPEAETSVVPPNGDSVTAELVNEQGTCLEASEPENTSAHTEKTECPDHLELVDGTEVVVEEDTLLVYTDAETGDVLVEGEDGCLQVENGEEFLVVDEEQYSDLCGAAMDMETFAMENIEEVATSEEAHHGQGDFYCDEISSAPVEEVVSCDIGREEVCESAYAEEEPRQDKPLQVKCSLSWERILNEGQGLVLGPANVEVPEPGEEPKRSHWKVVTRERKRASRSKKVEENNNLMPDVKSPIVMVKRLLLKRPRTRNRKSQRKRQEIWEQTPKMTPLKTKAALKAFQAQTDLMQRSRHRSWPATSDSKWKSGMKRRKSELSPPAANWSCSSPQRLPKVIIKRTGEGPQYQSFICEKDVQILQPVVKIERNTELDNLAMTMWSAMASPTSSAGECPETETKETANSDGTRGKRQRRTGQLMKVVELLQQWRQDEASKVAEDHLEEDAVENNNSLLCFDNNDDRYLCQFHSAESSFSNDSVESCVTNDISYDVDRVTQDLEGKTQQDSAQDGIAQQDDLPQEVIVQETIVEEIVDEAGAQVENSLQESIVEDTMPQEAVLQEEVVETSTLQEADSLEYTTVQDDDSPMKDSVSVLHGEIVIQEADSVLQEDVYHEEIQKDVVYTENEIVEERVVEESPQQSRRTSIEEELGLPLVCQVCGFTTLRLEEQANHIKTHSYHCQRCQLAFTCHEDFKEHLAAEHPTIEELHHCLLCQRTFPTAERHAQHKKGWHHLQMERSQRHTIHTLFRLFTGNECPFLPSLAPDEVKAFDWPSDPGVIHFYHDATPLQLAVQDCQGAKEEDEAC